MTLKKLLAEFTQKEGEIFCLKYIDTIINIKKCVTNETIETIIKFFQLYLEKDNHWSKDVLANIYFYDNSFFEKNFLKFCGSIVAKKIIRISSAKRFNLSVKEYVYGDYHIFIYDHNGTAIIMNYFNHNVYIFMTDSSEIAIVEFLRDIIIKDQENKGSIILHAAAVEKDNKVIAISGVKGAGKSTATMELIFHAGYHFFSGDKLFVRVENEQIIAKGWPDYPHLGVGTLCRYDTLINYCEEVDIKNKKANDKILLPPKKFYDIIELAINRNEAVLSAIIFPDFDLKNQSQVARIDNVPQRLVGNIEYKEDFPMAKWHDLVKPEYNRMNQEKILKDRLMKVPGYAWKGNFVANSLEDCLKM